MATQPAAASTARSSTPKSAAILTSQTPPASPTPSTKIGSAEGIEDACAHFFIGEFRQAAEALMDRYRF